VSYPFSYIFRIFLSFIILMLKLKLQLKYLCSQVLMIIYNYINKMLESKFTKQKHTSFCTERRKKEMT